MFRFTNLRIRLLQIAITSLALVVGAASLASVATAGPGDKLYVLKRNVVLRTEPSPQAPKVLELRLGQELMEFGRQGSWVEVGAVRTGGKSGWVLLSVVGTRKPRNAVQPPDPPGFKTFKNAFKKLNSDVERKTGIKLFTDAKALGDGMVQVTASDVWI